MTPQKKGTLSTESRETKSPVEIWGLTGGVASGKSTVAQFFEKAGITVIDADQVARQLSEEDGDAYPAILKRFGTADRAKLREIIFSDPHARKDLEAILHPLIQAESMRRIQLLADAMPGRHIAVIYEAALLVETGLYQTLDGLLVVEAPREDRIRRLVERDRISPEMAEKMLHSQTTDDERRKAATVIFHNTGSRDELRAQVQNFIHARKWKAHQK